MDDPRRMNMFESPENISDYGKSSITVDHLLFEGAGEVMRVVRCNEDKIVRNVELVQDGENVGMREEMLEESGLPDGIMGRIYSGKRSNLQRYQLVFCLARKRLGAENGRE